MASQKTPRPLKTNRNIGRFLVDSNPGFWFILEGFLAWTFFYFFSQFGVSAQRSDIQLINSKGAIIFAYSFALLGLGLGLFEKENRFNKFYSLQLILTTSLLAMPTGLFILYLTSYEKVGRWSLALGVFGASICIYFCVHVVGSFLLSKFPHRFLFLGEISSLGKKLLVEIKGNKIENFEFLPKLYELAEESLGDITKHDSLVTQIREHGISVIVLNWEKIDSKYSDFLFSALRQGLRIVDDAQYYSEIVRRIPVEEISSYYVLKMGFDIHRPIHSFIKRFIDVFISLFLIIGLSPLCLVIALIIRIESKGPAFYFQRRVSRFGKEFKLAKFRTMCDNAEAQSYVTSKVDSRITKFGSLLRILHLDELPQLWNVLVGEMSLVGPRPQPVKMVEDISHSVPLFKLRHIVRPGLSGLAQISQGKTEMGEEEMAYKLSYDLYYVKNFNVFLDIWIMCRTFFRMIQSTW